jgi:hypothetical protein
LETVELIKNFSWQTASWDLFILAFWAGASVFYAFASGRGRIINVLFAIYTAKLLTYDAPFLTQAIAKNLPESIVALQQLSVFAAIFLVLFVVLGRFVFHTSADNRSLGSVFYGIVFSLLQMGLLISIVLNYLPEGTRQQFGLLVQKLFIDTPMPFVWLLAPLGFLILLGKHVSDS